MNKRILLIAALALISAAAPNARASGKLRVVASVPELADMVRQVGGEHVRVKSLARGTEDIHQVVMKPSFVTRLNRADAVVYLGLTVEHSFLPGLLDVARNPRMRSDPSGGTCTGPGCIDCSEGVGVLERPKSLSRAEGEIHPYGNPHYNIGPDNGPLIAENIAKGLSRVDPEHAEDFGKNLHAYLKRLNGKLTEWRGRAAALKGLKAVSYHKDVAYLGRFTGIDFVDTLELKPGIAPTPTHLEALVRKMKQENVKLIVREQQYEGKTSDWLARQTGAKVAVIGTMAGAFPGTETYIDAIERNLSALLKAAGAENK